ncbi:hypothetical protein MRS44_016267 [Fusarium solani]|uniref:uncharacterized protein n=1 Tax=Fusarium solani TaxID=169388 RepID=UPI0032C3DD0C|nr:hypothetical protein MRS44_016267 [Fusarium solani]
MSRFIRRIINRRSIEHLDYEVDDSPEDPEERVTINNMRRIEKPKSMRWQARLSGSDMTKLLKGFRPSEMEQKWVIAASGPDGKGIIDVHLCRSWTGFEIYTVRVRVLAGEDGKPGDAEKNGGEVFEILYETSNKFDNTSTRRPIHTTDLSTKLEAHLHPQGGDTQALDKDLDICRLCHSSNGGNQGPIDHGKHMAPIARKGVTYVVEEG